MPVKKIAIQKLRTGMMVADPVYQQSNKRSVLLLTGNTLITSETQIRRLIDGGVKSVTIDTDRGIDTFQSLHNQQKWDDLAKLSKNHSAPSALMKKHLNTFLTTFTTTITKNITSRMLIGENRVALVLKDIVQRIENNVDILMAMLRLRSSNAYTYAHSINVTVLCISMANKLGFGFADISRFGTGTLLADIGMTNYPPGMTRRPSGLSHKEMEQIQKHPFYALDFVQQNGIRDKLVDTIIAQHHERFNGTGYPYGLKGDEIHSISRLFAIADVYVAMTSHRPHRSGFPPHMVLADILKLSGTLFDPKMAEFFIKHIGVFPVGNMIELTSGRYGLVASQNPNDPLHPVVVVFQTRKKLSSPKKIIRPDDESMVILRGQWELVDLAKEGQEYGKIKRGLDHRQYRINPNAYLQNI